MVILKNYDFLENLVKEGQLDKEAPFLKNGFCLADKEKNPCNVFVFHFIDGVIWASYGWTKANNKSFLIFYKEVEEFIFSFGMPILRIGKNKDFANHTKLYKRVDDVEIYQFVRGV